MTWREGLCNSPRRPLQLAEKAFVGAWDERAGGSSTNGRHSSSVGPQWQGHTLFENFVQDCGKDATGLSGKGTRFLTILFKIAKKDTSGQGGNDARILTSTAMATVILQSTQRLKHDFLGSFPCQNVKKRLNVWPCQQKVLPLHTQMRSSAVAYSESILHRGVEQLVARQAHNLEVACSSPAPATTFQTLCKVFLAERRFVCRHDEAGLPASGGSDTRLRPGTDASPGALRPALRETGMARRGAGRISRARNNYK